MKNHRRPYRIKKKKSILKNRWFWRMVLFLIFAGEIFYVIYFFSFFQLKEIRISGNTKVKTQAIQNIVPAQSIFLVNLKKIKEDILNSFPQIEEVEIDRKFPDKLNLNIKEREEIANFCPSNSCFLLDENGIIFEPASNENQLLRITPETGSLPRLRLGMKVLEKDLISLILETESNLKEDLKIPIAEVLLVSKERLNIKISEGWEIYFNPQNDLTWQLTKLKAVLENEIPTEKRKNLEYIDLRFGNLAPYKYR